MKNYLLKISILTFILLVLSTNKAYSSPITISSSGTYTNNDGLTLNFSSYTGTALTFYDLSGSPGNINTTDVANIPGTTGLIGRWDLWRIENDFFSSVSHTANFTFTFSNYVSYGNPKSGGTYYLVTRAVGAPNGTPWSVVTGSTVSGNTVTFSNVNIPFGDDDWTLASPDTNSSNSPLPVKFISFTANAVGKDIILNWATATEKNNELFEIEKSLDGTNFVPIGTEKGANNSNNIRKYSYVDASTVTSNVIYYRVKQVDYDKNNSYSNVAVVKMYNSKTVIAIFPNPANNTINVVFTSFEKSLTTITLSDNVGSVIKSFDVSPTVGENKYEVDISEIPKGIYVINLIVSGNRHAIRFIKN